MGADRNQWQFPKNEVGKVLGWSDEFSPSNPNASKGLVNKGPFATPGDLDGKQNAASNLTTLSSGTLGTTGLAVLAGSTPDIVQNTIGVPIKANKAVAEAETIIAGVKSIQTQFLAPTYTTFSTLVGGGYYSRMSKAAIDAAGYPAQTYFRSTDRFMPDGTTDAVNGGYWVDSDSEPQPEKYGVVVDEHVADNTASWNSYFAAMKALKRPIKVKSILRSNITSTVSCEAYGLVSGATATGMEIDLSNVTFYYSGTRNTEVFKFGATTLQYREAKLRLPSVIATGALTWPATLQTSDTGIKLINVYLSKVDENFVYGFTKGIEYDGCSYLEITGIHISDCKFSRVYTTYGLDPNASFTNENIGQGGRIGCTSAAALLGSAYGHVFTWNKVGSYRGQNNNRWYSGTFELGQPTGATHRVPVLFDGVGTLNVFHDMRHESDKGPAMICDGGLVSGANGPNAVLNMFEAEFNLTGGSGQQNNILEVNGAVGNIYKGPGSSEHHWSKHDLGKLVKSAGPATGAYLKGRELFVKQGVAAPSRVTTTASALSSHRNALMIANGTRVGVAVDTSKIKTFSFKFNAQEGFHGRPVFYAFDANGVALTGSITDDPAAVGATSWLPMWRASTAYSTINQTVINDTGKIYKLTTAGTSAASGGPTGTGTGIVDGTCVWDFVGTWGTETYVKGSLVFNATQPLLSGTPYASGGDSATGKEVWLSVRSEVKTVHMMVAGASNFAVLRDLEITGYSTMNVPGESYPTITGIGAMRVYSPVDDDGDTVKVTADPVTAGGHGYYAAGDLMGISNAAPASAAAAMWFALTAGWLAPAWTISTAYAVPGQLVTNDTGKIYQLVTAGTSAGATGPTGTGTAIADGTCVWDFIGNKPTSGALNRA